MAELPGDFRKAPEAGMFYSQRPPEIFPRIVNGSRWFISLEVVAGHLAAYGCGPIENDVAHLVRHPAGFVLRIRLIFELPKLQYIRGLMRRGTMELQAFGGRAGKIYTAC